MLPHQRVGDVMKQTLCASVAAICWLLVGCGGSQNFNLLTDGPGSWIVYPSPPTVPSLAGTPMTAVFRRDFVLTESANSGTLSWRCFKTGQLILNGTIVNAATNANWTDDAAALKFPTICDLALTNSKRA